MHPEEETGYEAVLDTQVLASDNYLPDLHAMAPQAALDLITATVAGLVEASTTKEGYLPRTIKMVINDRIIEMDRVIAAQFMKVMFIDSRVPDRPKALRHFADLMKCRFSKAPYHPGHKTTRIILEVNAVTLDVKCIFDITAMSANNTVNVSLPSIKRYVFHDMFESVGELHRFVWELGQVTGSEIRHDGILPLFTVTVEPEQGHISVAKLTLHPEEVVAE